MGSGEEVNPPATADDASALARASARWSSMSENQSKEKRRDDDDAWGGGAARLLLRLWGMCQSLVMMLKVKPLSV